jgi:hypothetical protein
MQKVVGSSPIIRFVSKPRKRGFSFLEGVASSRGPSRQPSLTHRCQCADSDLRATTIEDYRIAARQV